jgi:hypothetical protein
VAIDLTSYLRNLYEADPKVKLQVANLLKRAGYYTGKVTTDFIRLQDSIVKAEGDLAKISPYEPNLDRNTFYVQQAKAREAAGGGGEGKPDTIVSRTISSETGAARILEAIEQDFPFLELTAKQRKKYIDMVRKEQAKGSSATTTTYSEDGSQRVTRGGIDEEQFLIEKISDSNPGRASKVIEGYDILTKLLGGIG